LGKASFGLDQLAANSTKMWALGTTGTSSSKVPKAISITSALRELSKKRLEPHRGQNERTVPFLASYFATTDSPRFHLYF
jgi:hypothetical protein